jgi:fimbrial chaperone protein
MVSTLKTQNQRCHGPRAGTGILPRALLVFALALAASPSWAGLFSVTPVRIYMAPKDRAVAVTINNEGDDELVMQADIYLWKQKPGGEDDLTLTDDLILSPPIIKLAGRSRQVVRLAMIEPKPSSAQQTYRLVVREVPEAKPANQNVQLQIALAFSMPVFITPPGAKRALVCTAERASADSARVTCENKGNAYAQPREFALTSAAGVKLASRDSGGYILPSITRTFDIKRAAGPLPGGSAKLDVMLDDGTTQSFDVKLAE